MLIHSLLNLFLSLVPVLIYLGIIYITIPYGSIDFKKSISYFFCGVVSISLIITFLLFNPHFQDYVYPPFRIFATNDSDTQFIQNFIQVALMEEFFKFIGFFIGSKIDKGGNSPIATMFYCGVAALGMSCIENFQYATHNGTHIIFIRSIATMLIHFISGLIMGYWIAISQMKTTQQFSILGVFMKKFKWLRALLFSACAIFFAASFHGLFDYSISMLDNNTNDPIMIIIIIIGVLITYICSRNLIGRTFND